MPADRSHVFLARLDGFVVDRAWFLRQVQSMTVRASQEVPEPCGSIARSRRQNISVLRVPS